MSRESKIFSVNSKQAVANRVKEYESFGWELLSINGFDVSMSRESQNEVYAQLIKHEYNYEVLREKQEAIIFPRRPAPFSFLLMLMLLILFIVPGVLYIVYIIYKNREFKEKEQIAIDEYNMYNEQIKKVCETSRAVFFSRNR